MACAGDGMKHHAALAEIPQSLRCPAHHRRLQWHRDELVTLRCESGCQFELRDGIPRFVPIDQYAESFGLQWNAYRRTQLDSYTGCSYSRLRLERCLGLPLVSLADKTVLEVGAGAGRFSEWLLPHSGGFVALDASTAVDAHRANFAQRYDYLLVQADIHDPRDEHDESGRGEGVQQLPERREHAIEIDWHRCVEKAVRDNERGWKYDIEHGQQQP